MSYKAAADSGVGRAALVAASGLCLVSIFYLPNTIGGYRLARWGLAAIVISVLSLYTAIRRGSLRHALPPEQKLFGLASAYAGAAIVLPLFGAPHPILHLSGSFVLLSGLLLSYLIAVVFSHVDRRSLRRSLLMLVTTGAAIAAVVVLQQAGLPLLNRSFPGAEFRAHGTFGNPNWAAAFLLPLVPIAFGLFQETDEAAPRSRYAVLGLTIAAGVIATLSKGGTIALVGGIVAYLLLSRSLGNYVKGLVVFFSLGLIGILHALALSQGWYHSLPWMQGRLFIWQAAELLFWRHPFAGSGLSGSIASLPTAVASLVNGDPNAFVPLGTIRFLHNDFIQIAVEGGIVSALLFLLFIGFALVRSYQRGDALSRGLGAGLAALALYAIFDSPLHLPASWMLFWFIIGLLMTGSSGTQTEPSARPSAGSLRIVTAILVIAVLFSLAQGMRHVAGILLWSDGKHAMKIRTLPRSLKELAAANALLPDVGEVRFDYANALAMKERYADALHESEAASALHFDFANLFFTAKMYEYYEGPRTAKGKWQELSMSFPFLVRPHYELGRLAIILNDREQARQEFQKALSISQQSSGAAEYRYQAAALLAAMEKAPRIRK